MSLGVRRPRQRRPRVEVDPTRAARRLPRGCAGRQTDPRERSADGQDDRVDLAPAGPGQPDQLRSPRETRRPARARASPSRWSRRGSSDVADRAAPDADVADRFGQAVACRRPVDQMPPPASRPARVERFDPTARHPPDDRGRTVGDDPRGCARPGVPAHVGDRAHHGPRRSGVRPGRESRGRLRHGRHNDEHDPAHRPQRSTEDRSCLLRLQPAPARAPQAITPHPRLHP
jgi:hypothetical protein